MFVQSKETYEKIYGEKYRAFIVIAGGKYTTVPHKM